MWRWPDLLQETVYTCHGNLIKFKHNFKIIRIYDTFLPFCRVTLSEMYLCLLFNDAITILCSIDARMINKYGTVGATKVGRGSQSTWRKTPPVPLHPPQIPRDFTWDWTWAAVVESLTYGTEPRNILLPGMWCSVVWYIGTSVLEEPAPFIFSVDTSTLKIEAAGASETLIATY
jgi:hypothetical protein